MAKRKKGGTSILKAGAVGAAAGAAVAAVLVNDKAKEMLKEGVETIKNQATDTLHAMQIDDRVKAKKKELIKKAGKNTRKIVKKKLSN